VHPIHHLGFQPQVDKWLASDVEVAAVIQEIRQAAIDRLGQD
jgi:hypothetical protein